ncbi:hypothetical protein BR93DRAFT_921842 [Coniochaeta sp. PMI_546]|nr:hypothetical protein BR93DRAFT_921842 [Coniochaeta sp. PMI_546]
MPSSATVLSSTRLAHLFCLFFKSMLDWARTLRATSHLKGPHGSGVMPLFGQWCDIMNPICHSMFCKIRGLLRCMTNRDYQDSQDMKCLLGTTTWLPGLIQRIICTCPCTCVRCTIGLYSILGNDKMRCCGAAGIELWRKVCLL